MPATAQIERAADAARDRLSPALLRRLAVVDAGAAAALALAVAHLPGAATASWQVLAAVALLVLGRAVRLPLRLGERRVLVCAWAEGSVLLSFVVAGGAWTTLLVGLVVFAHQLPRRLPLWRSAFNAAALVGPVGVAALVFEGLAGPGLLSQSLALLAAAPFITVLNLLAISTVVAAAHDEPWTAPVREDVVTELAGLGVQVAVCIGMLACAGDGQVVAALLLPVLAALVLQQLLRRLAVVTEQDALTRLEQASRLVRTLDLDRAAADLLARAGQLFGVEQAQLRLRGPEAQTWTSDGQPPSESVHALVRALRARDALVELRLVFPRAPQLSQAEEQVLATFTATVATAIGHCLDYAAQSVAARTDALTGLGNRVRLVEEVDVLLAAGEVVALVVLDLDRFTQVNETLGHATGDRVLQEVGTRLRGALRTGETAVRLGSDEFAVLLSGLPRERAGAVALQRARQLLAVLQVPFLLEDLELPVEASAGVAVAGEQHDADALLRRAGSGVHRAKEARVGVALPEDDDAGARGALRLLGQLRQGLRSGELEVHFQPVVDLRTDEVVAHEALVRWQHPEQGLLLPAAFIPAVEQTALILPLTLEVLRQSVRATLAWSQVRPGLAVAVNVSPRCLLVPDFASQVLVLLSEEGLSVSQLTVEITETLALADLDAVDRNLSRLRDAGVHLSLDDFGTGFSSMSALRRLPVHEVKVDRRFVSGAVASPGDRAIIESTVTLARGLGLRVVAEGIESPEQLALVRALGCDRAQGYLLGRPAPASSAFAGAVLPHLLPRQAAR